MTDGEVESGKIEWNLSGFLCGSIIKFADSKWRVGAIHTGKGEHSMEWMAYEIRRIYLHPQDNVKVKSVPNGDYFSSFSNSNSRI